MVAGKRLYLSELCYLNLINITQGFKYCEVHLLPWAECSQCSEQNVNTRRGMVCLCLWQLLGSSREGGEQDGVGYFCLFEVVSVGVECNIQNNSL